MIHILYFTLEDLTLYGETTVATGTFLLDHLHPPSKNSIFVFTYAKN